MAADAHPDVFFQNALIRRANRKSALPLKAFPPDAHRLVAAARGQADAPVDEVSLHIARLPSGGWRGSCFRTNGNRRRQGLENPAQSFRQLFPSPAMVHLPDAVQQQLFVIHRLHLVAGMEKAEVAVKAGEGVKVVRLLLKAVFPVLSLALN